MNEGSDLAGLSVTAVSQAVRSGKTRAATMAAEALARMAGYERVQPAVWIHRLAPEAVMARAEQVDRRLAAGEDLPLAGVTFAVKDNMDVVGSPTTAGCPAFAYQPEANATVVDRLIGAGAILVGKTNLDQFATGLVGSRSPYGACAAVHNRDYISGGSSSGSAVAVAAGLVSFALGTDTAGSGRVPAALNGLFGFKPTKGRWSTTGLVPACRSLDCITVFTTDAAGARLIDQAVAGFDPADPYSRRAPAPPVAAAGRFRLGVPQADQLDLEGDGEALRLHQAAVSRLEALGGQVVEIDIAPLLEAARLLYQGPWVAERAAAIEPLLRLNPGALHPVVREIVRGGLAFSAVDAFRAAYQLKTYERLCAAVWAAADVLVLPTTPTTYRLREVLAEPLMLNAKLGRYTNFVNLLDMSAIALPAGFRANATGYGVTLIGSAWADEALLQLAQRYEEAGPMPETPKLDTGGVRQTVKLAVVGAHLAAMPLHWQLTSRDARLVRRCKTAEAYHLFAMAETTPPKPALVHVGPGGSAIEVEVYELDVEAFGSFVVEVPPPLAIGTVTLDDGSDVKGFVAEPRALTGATEITALGGWRAYIRSLSEV